MTKPRSILKGPFEIIDYPLRIDPLDAAVDFVHHHNLWEANTGKQFTGLSQS